MDGTKTLRLKLFPRNNSNGFQYQHPLATGVNDINFYYKIPSLVIKDNGSQKLLELSAVNVTHTDHSLGHHHQVHRFSLFAFNASTMAPFTNRRKIVLVFLCCRYRCNNNLVNE
jgi:hypothetical protein